VKGSDVLKESCDRWGSTVLRAVAMATNFWTKIANDWLSEPSVCGNDVTLSAPIFHRLRHFHDLLTTVHYIRQGGRHGVLPYLI